MKEEHLLQFVITDSFLDVLLTEQTLFSLGEIFCIQRERNDRSKTKCDNLRAWLIILLTQVVSWWRGVRGAGV